MEVIIMIKELISLGKFAKKSSVFAGGVLFGSLGLKHVYAKAVATSYKLKDGIDATVSTVKQHADDVLEEAKDLYAEEKSAELVVETSEK